MRPIHLAQLDKVRPVVILTRESVRPYLGRVTVAPITTTVRGLGTEVALGRANGLDHDCVASCDNILTISAEDLGPPIGYLLERQESDLAAAVVKAFDLG